MIVTTEEIVFTIGHSNRSLEDLVSLLRDHRISTLVDVRRAPWSRRHPHFCKPALARAFEALPMTYVHVEALGGHREPAHDSPNTALADAMRGYADYTATREFRDALERSLALPAPLAFMCAEALPSACHRSILSDELVRQGRHIVHVLAEGRTTSHVLDRRAVDDGSRLLYPSTSEAQLALPLE